MDADLKKVHQHMIGLGCGSLSHANFLAHFYDYKNDYWSQLAVLQAAHACEIFMKARLAQEHPLLIFDTIPKSTSKHIGESGLLNFESLLQDGRTIDYADLPEKVWAATGIKLSQEQLDKYKQFGYLRNSIQHFASPNYNVRNKITDFIYSVIDPFINTHWGLYAVDFCDDSEGYEYLVPVIADAGVEFLIPPGMASELIELIKDGSPSYIRRLKNQAISRGYDIGKI